MIIITPEGREINLKEADDDSKLLLLEQHVNACDSFLGSDHEKTKKAVEEYDKRLFELLDPYLI
jgi:hypothetical protein